MMSLHHTRLKKSLWERVRKQVFERDGYRCQQCGKPSRLECDHIIPLSQGGDPWAMDNLQSLCGFPCHVSKTKEENSPFLRDAVTKRWRGLVSELV